MFWVNGQRADSIALSDRSFQYGDGCFTTILTRHGQIEGWSAHVTRMEACLRLLGIEFPDWQRVRQWLETASLPAAKAGLKLHVSRGEGGRGYSPAHVTTPNVTISHFPFPAHYEQWQQNGVALGVCERRLGHNPLLAGHKHNNRLEQVLLKQELDEQGYADGLALDIDGFVIETTMANLFWCREDTLFTPDLTLAGVAGTMRERVLQCALTMGLHIEVGQFTLCDIEQADEVFICNALLGVAPVSAISHKMFTIGPQTRRFQENLSS